MRCADVHRLGCPLVAEWPAPRREGVWHKFSACRFVRPGPITRCASRPAPRVVYRSTVQLCDEVLAVTEAHTARALALLLEDPRLPPRDAIHVAVVESAGKPPILSTDKDFDGIASVRRIDPAGF